MINGRNSSSLLLNGTFGGGDAALGAIESFEGIPAPAPVAVAVLVPELGLGLWLELVPAPSRKERNRDAKSVSGVERVRGMERGGLHDFQLESQVSCKMDRVRTHPFLM